MAQLACENRVIFGNSIATVYDYAGRFLFVCDLHDARRIKPCKFYKATNGYSLTRINGKRVYAHRLILNAPDDKQVDHISRDITDNRRCNLRLCTSQENKFNQSISRANTSGAKGVCRDKARKKWLAYISFDKKLFNLGRFDNIDDAIAKRRKAELLYFGSFATEAIQCK